MDVVTIATGYPASDTENEYEVNILVQQASSQSQRCGADASAAKRKKRATEGMQWN